MIANPSQAIDEMFTMIKEAWDLSPYTLNYDIVWGNVAADYNGQNDLHGNPIPWMHVQCLHESSKKVSLKGPAGSRFQNTGTLICNVHVAEGKGAIHAHPLIQVVSDAFQGKASPNGVWFRRPQVTDIGFLGTWYIVSFNTTFLYDLVR